MKVRASAYFSFRTPTYGLPTNRVQMAHINTNVKEKGEQKLERERHALLVQTNPRFDLAFGQKAIQRLPSCLFVICVHFNLQKQLKREGKSVCVYAFLVFACQRTLRLHWSLDLFAFLWPRSCYDYTFNQNVA